MANRVPNFKAPQNPNPAPRLVRTRYGLREPETKPQPLKKEASIFSYERPGRGVSGESSN